MKDSLEELAEQDEAFEKFEGWLILCLLFAATLGGLIGLGIRVYEYFEISFWKLL